MRKSIQKKFKIYRSSAGSGKTFTLVKEYLKLVLEHDRDNYFRNICAITFTNKAANEMKDRVLKNLYQFAQDEVQKDAQVMFELIQKECSLSSEQIKERAQKVLSQILHHFSEFKISTIDSFLHRLIRSFSFELDLPQDMSIETDTQILIEEAIEKLFEEAKSDELLADFMLDYIRTNSLEDRSWKIRRQLKDFAQNIFKEDAILFDQSIKQYGLDDFKKIKNELYASLTKQRQQLDANHKRFHEIMDAAALEYDDFNRKSSGFISYLDKLKLDETKAMTDAALRVFESDNWANNAATVERQSAIEHFQDDLRAIFLDSMEKAQAIKDHLTFLKNIHNLALYHKIKALINEVKLERKCLHISEFNKRISDLLKYEPVPYVYERIGEKINHYLIDEFQDTSKLQWYNLLPLVENALSKAQFNMVVGDAKQSIYRFRNGDVMQFVNLPEVRDAWSGKLLSSHELFEAAKDEAHLDTNYRSKAELVSFNNELYELLKEVLDPEMRKMYDGHSQESNSGTDGYVEALLFPPGSVEDLNSHLAGECIRAVKESIEDGFLASDLCILVRNKREAAFLARELNLAGYKIITDDSLLLMNNAAVAAVYHLMRFLEAPSDEYHLAESMRFLGKERSDFDWKNSLRPVLNKELTWQDGLVAANIHLDPEQMKRRDRLGQALDISRAFGVDVGTHQPLSEFIAKCAEFDRDLRYHHHQFFDYIDELADSMSISGTESEDVITIMTVHKSKGLEFPVVILPFTSWSNQGSKGYMWTDKTSNISPIESGLLSLSGLKGSLFEELWEQEERLWLADCVNLLYVATTRPKERLYLFCAEKKNQNFYKYLSQYLAQLKDWDEEQNALHLGARKRQELKERTKEKSDSIAEKISLNSWEASFALGLPEVEIYKQHWNDPDSRGKIVHTILASAKDFMSIRQNATQIAKAYHWTATQKNELFEILEQIEKTKELNPFFDSSLELLIERDFLDEKGNIHRPDRLLVHENSVKILDFKTGKRSDKDLSQMSSYEQLLTSIGYKVDSIYLYYSQDAELIKV